MSTSPAVPPAGVLGDGDAVSPEAVAVANALATIDSAHRRLRTRLAKRFGLSTTDLIALFLAAEEGATPKFLSAELGLTSGAVTVLIDRLEKAGRVHRVASPTDRRSVVIELTSSGIEAVLEIRQEYRATISGVLAQVVDPTSAAVIVDTLERAAGELDALAVDGD